ncbi:MAG: hypothetical protein IPP12_17855 [Nitrospira sp.]|nr:hypothetical protein [Nitrospira sp.]
MNEVVTKEMQQRSQRLIDVAADMLVSQGLPSAAMTEGSLTSLSTGGEFSQGSDPWICVGTGTVL